jgi:hypothetical protein
MLLGASYAKISELLTNFGNRQAGENTASAHKKKSGRSGEAPPSMINHFHLGKIMKGVGDGHTSYGL